MRYGRDERARGVAGRSTKPLPSSETAAHASIPRSAGGGSPLQPRGAQHERAGAGRRDAAGAHAADRRRRGVAGRLPRAAGARGRPGGEADAGGEAHAASQLPEARAAAGRARVRVSQRCGCSAPAGGAAWRSRRRPRLAEALPALPVVVAPPCLLRGQPPRTAGREPAARATAAGRFSNAPARPATKRSPPRVPARLLGAEPRQHGGAHHLPPAPRHGLHV